jgi:diguanylate cyclase (GGDEF)-like protein
MDGQTAAIILLVVLAAALAYGLWRAHRRVGALAAARDGLVRQRDELAGQRDALVAERDGLVRQRDELAGQRDALVAERDGLVAERDAVARERDEARAEQKAAQQRSDRSRQDVERALAREHRARLAERGWAQELRSQVLALHQRESIFAGEQSATALVLRVAVELLGAERGLLLSRRDDDDDGRLDLVCHEGFAHDPGESAVAQHFARRVIARDETVRENDPARLAESSRTAADDEIDCLVAIPIYLRDDFAGVVVCANRPGGFEEYDDDVLLALGDHAGSVLHNGRLRGELRTSYLATVGMLADAIAAKDPFVGGHSEEVATYVGAVAGRLGLESRRTEELVFGSLLHDLGKIGISERILLKPERLTPEERAVIELHPRIGYRLVSRIPALDTLATAVLHHHERWDGTGYPARLSGEQIPLEARIVGVADAFSAMTSDRPYSRRRTIDEACAELEHCAGSQFDPSVVEAFVEEVRAHPPEPGLGRLGEALSEPELTVLIGDGPLLGSGTLAIIDNLTLLYSHRYLHESAAAAERQAAVQRRPFAIVMAELAGLPLVNARDGYAQGDELIRMAARTLQDAALTSGGTACRYGGPRLALLVPDADESEAQAVAGRLAQALPSEGTPRVAVAVQRPGETGAQVVERARVALRPEAASPTPDGSPVRARW